MGELFCVLLYVLIWYLFDLLFGVGIVVLFVWFDLLSVILRLLCGVVVCFLVSCFLLSSMFFVSVGLTWCGGLRWRCLFCCWLRMLVIVYVVGWLDVVVALGL